MKEKKGSPLFHRYNGRMEKKDSGQWIGGRGYQT
jgi:hypothetical protein